MKTLWTIGGAIMLMLIGSFLTSGTSSAQPVELGTIAWLRDLDEAKALAKATDKPILLLFQEVPG